MIIRKYGKWYIFECPKCKTRARADEDQANGRVSIQCVFGDCDYHETKNWLKEEVKND